MSSKQTLIRPNALNRGFLSTLLAVSLGLVPLSTSLASSTTAASFYKMGLGNVEIVALSDGTNQRIDDTDKCLALCIAANVNGRSMVMHSV